jgi:periplasmic divalent cation tolerance protein
MSELVQLMTTMPDRAAALELAREVVRARLAACVQTVGPVTSIYHWEEALREDEETLCLMKVPEDRLAELVGYVRGRHPYDTPELTAVPCSYVDQRYLEWAVGETAPR